MTKNLKILLSVLAIFILLAIFYYLNHCGNCISSIELFNSENLFNDPRYEKDRTQLYGTLFLDNLDAQIKNMTDPRIQYDNKRIDIIKYSDILL